jgi:hypothetical protein
VLDLAVEFSIWVSTTPAGARMALQRLPTTLRWPIHLCLRSLIGVCKRLAIKAFEVDYSVKYIEAVART